jgi:dimeric dUTPase (all-alpha-NTP-PPase superfamily)
MFKIGDIFKVGSYVRLKEDEETKVFCNKYGLKFDKTYKIEELLLDGWVKLDIFNNGYIVHINNLILYHMTEIEIEEYNKINKISYQDIPVMVDKLQEILNKQSELQDKLNKNPKYMSFMDRVRFIQDNALHLNIEFAELLKNLPFKYWKKYSPEQLNGDEYKKNRKEVIMEYIDMACFFFNIGIALDITSKEFYNIYMEKNNINFKRQDNKY